MALPDVFSPTEPQASEAVSTGPAKLQANFQALADFLGIPSSPTQLTGAAFSITSGGIVTIVQPGLTLAADPTTPLGAATKEYVDNKALGLPTGTAAGTNTYTVALTPVPASLSALVGVPVTITVPLANTGAATMNPNGLGAVSIVKGPATQLAAGDIPANSTLLYVYDGANFNLIGCLDASSLQGSPISAIVPTANQVLQFNGTVWIPASNTTVNTFNTVAVTSQSVTGTVLAAAHLTLTMPASGGPWRPLVQYRVECHGAVTLEMWVSDGTNSFANAVQFGALSGTPGTSSFNVTEYTPVTYANGAAVTFTLQAQTTGVTANIGDASHVTGKSWSQFSVVIISGN